MFQPNDEVFVIYNTFQRNNGVFCSLHKAIILEQIGDNFWKVKIPKLNNKERIIPEKDIFTVMEDAWKAMETFAVKPHRL